MKSIVGLVATLVLGFCGALAGFGLLLALFWWPDFSRNIEYKLATAVFAATVGFILGGVVTALVYGRYPIYTGVLFGFLSGLAAFGYLFGPDFRLLLTLPVSTLLGAAGGFIVSKQKQKIQWSKS